MTKDVQPTGEPIAIDAQVAAEVRRDIHDAILAAEKGDKLLNQALEALRKLVVFDLAVVVRYSPKPWLSARLVHLYNAPGTAQEDLWPQKWFPVDPEVLERLTTGGAEARCVGNIEKWLTDTPAQKLKEDLNIQHVVESGYKSFMAVLLELEDTPVPFQVNLLKLRDYNYYTTKQLRELGPLDLNLDLAVSTACHLMDAESKRMAWHLVEALYSVRVILADNTVRDQAKGDQADVYARELANEVVKQLAKAYGWQSISIFKVDHRTKTFSLLASVSPPQQASGALHEIADDHSETFDGRSVIAATYHENENVEGDDTSEPKIWDCNDQASAKLRPVSRRAKSALCYPIRSEGEIIWLLNLEDARAKVFVEHEQKLVVPPIVSAIEIFFRNLMSSRIRDAIFQVATRGVILTDLTNHIVEMNPAAERLLEIKIDRVSGLRLNDLFVNLTQGANLLSANEIDQLPMKLKRGNSYCDVAITSRQLPIETGRRVFFLDDLEEKREIAALRKFQHAAELLTAETQPNLALAVASLRRLLPSLERDQAAHLSHLIDMIKEADVNYSRIATFFPDQRRDKARWTTLSFLRVLKAELETIPKSMRDNHFVCKYDAREAYVMHGDSMQLAIAIRLILSYLRLLFYRDDDRIDLILAMTEGRKKIKFTAVGKPKDGKVDLTNIRDVDHAQIMLNIHLLYRIIERTHQGELIVQDDADVPTGFQIFFFSSNPT